MSPTLCRRAMARRFRCRANPFTLEQMAEMDFDAKPEGETRSDKVREIANRVRRLSLAAAVLLKDDKATLVRRVEEKHDALGPLLMKFSRAAEDAEVLRDILRCAEVRLAIALAVVEGPQIAAEDAAAEQVS